MRKNRHAVVAAAAMATLLGSFAQAATLNWDADGVTPVNGGSGTWDTTSPLWEDGLGAYTTWNNATPDAAVFGGTAGTVSLGTAITAASVTINSNPYVLDLNGNDLTVTGATAGTLVNAAVITNTGALATFTTGSFGSGSTRVTGNLNLTFGGAWTPVNNNDFTGTMWWKPTATAALLLNASGRTGTASGVIKLDASNFAATGTADVNWSSPDNTQHETFTRDIEIIHGALGTTRFRVNGAKEVTLAGSIGGGTAGGSGLIFTGANQGNLVLAGNNTYAGSTVIGSQSNSLTLAHDNALGATSGVSFASAGLNTLGFKGGVNINLPTITVDLGSTNPAASGWGTLHAFSGDNTLASTVTTTSSTTNNSWIGAEAGSSLTLKGVVGGSGRKGITKVGFGTVVLTNGNTFGRANISNALNATVLREGTLRLDFSQAMKSDGAGGLVAFDDNIINHGSANFDTNVVSELILAGGTLEVKGRAGATNLQRFKDRATLGFTILPGASAVKVDQNGATSVTVNLGRLMAPLRSVGSSVDFTLPTAGGIVLPSTGIGADNTIVSANGAAFATVGGNDWAATDVAAAGLRNIVGGSTLTGFYTPNDATTLAGNADMSGGVDTTLEADATITSLRFNNAAARTITAENLVEGVPTPRVLTTGGILVTPAVGANVSTITGGTLRAAASTAATATQDLVIHQHNTAGDLRIGSVIADNTTGTTFISGLTKSGAGRLVLTAANTYTGETHLNGGMIKLEGSGALGNGKLFFHDGVLGLPGGTTFTRTMDTTAGDGKVQFLGSGGFAAYGGDVTINLGGLGATLSLGNTTAAAGSVPTGSALILGASDADGTVIVQNPLFLRAPNAPQLREIRVLDGLSSTNVDARLTAGIAGANQDGGLLKTGDGTLEITGVTSTYKGQTHVTAGTLLLTAALDTSSQSSITVNSGASLLVGNGGTAGSMNGPLINNGSTVFNRSDTLTYSRVISGTGSLRQEGTGTLILTGNSTFTGATTIAAGTLQIGNNGTSGSFVGNILNNAALTFSRSNTSTYAGVISGSGTVTKVGSGALILSGTNTYAGGTFLNGGLIEFSALDNFGTAGLSFNGGGVRWAAGNTLDISARTIAMPGAATFNTNGNDVTIAGNIGGGGAGALTKTGAGTLTLTGANTFTGGATVQAGTLLINSAGGAGSGTVTASFGTLGGTGTVGALTVIGGAHVAPGSGGAGTFTAGALTLNNGAVFDYDLADVTTAGGGVNDLLVVASASVNNPLPADLFNLNINALSGNLADGQYLLIDSATSLSGIVNPAQWQVTNSNAAGKSYAFALDANGDLVLNVSPAGPLESVWDRDDSLSNWSATTSWVGGVVPNAIGAVATFGSKITEDRTVNVDGAQIVGTINFDDGNSYTLAAATGGAGGSITIDAATSGAVNVVSGSHAITAPVTLNKDTTFTVTPAASTLTVSSLSASSVNVTKAGAGKLVVNNVRASGLEVAAGTLQMIADPTAAGASKVATLTIGANAKLDLNANKLVTDKPLGTFSGGAYSGIQGDIARAYNFGTWDGPGGLMTSQDLANPLSGPLGGTTTIAVNKASEVLFIGETDTGVFAGQTVTGATTIAMYTYAGDVNLDGLVDAADYGVIDNWVQFPGTDGYMNGDFNYDGVIDAADYGIIDNTVQLQGAPIPVGGAIAAGAGAGLSGVTAVPEPSACGFALLAAGAALTRRRRRRQQHQ